MVKRDVRLVRHASGARWVCEVLNGFVEVSPTLAGVPSVVTHEWLCQVASTAEMEPTDMTWEQYRTMAKVKVVRP